MSSGPWIADLAHRESKRFVVSEDSEHSPFEKISEVPYAQMNRKELLIEGTVIYFGGFETATEECERLPPTMYMLLKDTADGSI